MSDVIRDSLWQLGGVKKMLQRYFMENTDITDLVMPTLDDEAFSFKQNWLGGQYTTDGGRTATLQGYCMTTPFIDGTVTDMRTFIGMETFGLDFSPSKRIQKIGLQIYIYTYKSTVNLTTEEEKQYTELGYAGNRLDVLVQAVNRAMYHDDVKMRFGIGEVSFDDVPRPIGTHIPNFNYYGRVISYVIHDFYITNEIRNKYLRGGDIY